jgi:hypothetical protein
VNLEACERRLQTGPYKEELLADFLRLAGRALCSRARSLAGASGCRTNGATTLILVRGAIVATACEWNSAARLVVWKLSLCIVHVGTGGQARAAFEHGGILEL